MIHRASRQAGRHRFPTDISLGMNCPRLQSVIIHTGDKRRDSCLFTNVTTGWITHLGYVMDTQLLFILHVRIPFAVEIIISVCLIKFLNPFGKFSRYWQILSINGGIGQLMARFYLNLVGRCCLSLIFQIFQERVIGKFLQFL